MKSDRKLVIFFTLLCCAIGTYGQQPQAMFVTQQGSVNEADGSVEVCVNVSNANNIPAEGAELTVSVLEGQGANPVSLEDDYQPQQQFITFTNETNSSQCVYFELIQDNLVEVTESMLVRIRSTDGRLTTDSNFDIITFSVEDSDNLTLGFTQTLYTIQENVPLFTLCTQLEKGQIAVGVQPIVVSFTVATETANLNEDFMMPLVNSDFVFNSTSTIGSLQCVQFNIINDSIIERNETFSVQLREVSAVSFSERITTITIIDDDFATVALNEGQMVLNEGNNTMNTTVTFSVVITDEKDGIDREVIVNITTYEISATGLNDFALLTESVTFPENARRGDTKSIQILVFGDNFIETDEVFSVNISTFFPDLIGDPGSATVTIIHDGDNICPSLEDPLNGNVEITNNTVGSTATYSCLNDFMLIGPQQRICTNDLGWSGQEPVCLRICENLNIENGNVDDGLAVQGVTANYSCDTGFRLVGISSRVCQNNGQWSGNAPLCKETLEPPTTTSTTQTPPGVGSSNSRNVGIGVGVTVAILVIIAVVVVTVVVVLLLIKMNRARKRYIVNDDTDNNSGSKSIFKSGKSGEQTRYESVPMNNGESQNRREGNGTSTVKITEIDESIGSDI